jgi:hypothetical protein
VRNAGVVEGNRPVSDNEWESIKRGGDAAIRRWINAQLSGKSCAVVLIGRDTAGRKWINYEIVQAWNDRNGVLGVHVHKLLDAGGHQTTKGSNPFTLIPLRSSGRTLASIVKTYEPPFNSSTSAYDHIRVNLANWVEIAISIRDNSG